MTIESLNAMSNEELMRLADELGIAAPRGLDRPFLIMEIYEAAQDAAASSADGESAGLDLKRSAARAEGDGADVPHDAPSELPRRYNESAMRAMIRDPEWAYIFWDVREDERSSGREGDQRSLSVRMLELANGDGDPASALSWFDFPVQGDDGEWFVNLPEDGASYVFEIAAQAGNERRIIARSNAVRAPRARRPEDYARLPRRTRNLMELAGLPAAVTSEERSSTARRIMPLEEERG